MQTLCYSFDLTEKKPRLANYHKDIEAIVKDNRKTLIVAPLSSGKTYLYMNYLIYVLRDFDEKIVIVVPNISQIYQMEQEYKDLDMCIVCTNKMYRRTKIVVTTPDSLPRVMQKVDEEGVSYNLIIDEAHEKVTSRNFRQKFKNIDLYSEEALKVVHLTGTAGALVAEKYDAIIRFNACVKKRIPVKLVTTKEVTPSLLAKVIGDYLKQGKKVQLLNDDKAMNEVIENLMIAQLGERADVVQQGLTFHFEDFSELLEKGNKTTTKYYSGCPKSKEMKSIIDGVYPEGLKFLVSTQAIKAGVNLFNPTNTVQLIVAKRGNFDLSMVIQQMGRNRNTENIDCICLFIPYNDNSFLPQFGNLKATYEATRRQATDIYTRHVRDFDLALGEPSTDTLDVACAVRNGEAYEMDKNLVASRAYRIWCGNLLRNPIRLAYELQHTTALNLDVEIVNMDKIIVEGKADEELKALKRDKKETFEVTINTLKQLEVEEREIIFTTKQNDLETITDKVIKELARDYHRCMTSKYKKLIHDATKYLTDGDKVEAHELVLQQGEGVKLEITKKEDIKLNQQYNEDKEIKRTYKAYKNNRKKNAQRLYFIRTALVEVERKQGRISESKKQDIVSAMVRERLYPTKYKYDKIEKKRIPNSEATYINALALFELDLKCIYNLSGDRISSVKTKD